MDINEAKHRNLVVGGSARFFKATFPNHQSVYSFVLDTIKWCSRVLEVGTENEAKEVNYSEEYPDVLNGYSRLISQKLSQSDNKDDFKNTFNSLFSHSFSGIRDFCLRHNESNSK